MLPKMYTSSLYVTRTIMTMRMYTSSLYVTRTIMIMRSAANCLFLTRTINYIVRETKVIWGIVPFVATHLKG